MEDFQKIRTSHADPSKGLHKYLPLGSKEKRNQWWFKRFAQYCRFILFCVKLFVTDLFQKVNVCTGTSWLTKCFHVTVLLLPAFGFFPKKGIKLAECELPAVRLLLWADRKTSEYKTLICVVWCWRLLCDFEEMSWVYFLKLSELELKTKDKLHFL